MSVLNNNLLIKLKEKWSLICLVMAVMVVLVHLIAYYNYIVLSLDDFKKEDVAPITTSDYIDFRDNEGIKPPARDAIFENKYYKKKLHWQGRVVSISKNSIYIDIDSDTRIDLRVDLYAPYADKSVNLSAGDKIDFVFRSIACEGCTQYAIKDAIKSAGGAGWFYPMTVALFIDFPYDREEQAKYFTPALYGTEGIIL